MHCRQISVGWENGVMEWESLRKFASGNVKDLVSATDFF